MARTASRIVNEMLQLKAGENCLILTDAERPPSISHTLATVAAATGAEVMVITIQSRDPGNEPPLPVAAAMAETDVLIIQTSFSMSHTNAMRQAMAKGVVRVANCAHWIEDTAIRGGATADLKRVTELTDRVTEYFKNAKIARVTTKEGTDLTIMLSGRTPLSMSNTVIKKGKRVGLPGGEMAISPVEGGTEGKIATAYSTDPTGPIKEPFYMTIEKGRVVEVKGGKEAGQIRKLLEKDENANNIAEFAIGTNYACRLSGIMREDKKVLGTIHLGIGDSKSLGGTVEAATHFDVVILGSTVEVDGEKLVVDGELLEAVLPNV